MDLLTCVCEKEETKRRIGTQKASKSSITAKNISGSFYIN
jgi:hypothetical protein